MLISPVVLYFALLGRRGNRASLHVGAHKAEEAGQYRRLGITKVDWVEAQPELCEALRERFAGTNHRVFEGCVWSASGDRVELRITNNSQSTSVLRMGRHSDYYPQVEVNKVLSTRTIRLDELVPDDNYGLVNLDIQGAELEALKGMGALLQKVSVVYTEVNREYLYEGCPLVDEVDTWLDAEGFRRTVTKWTSKGWGDAIYIRDRTWWRKKIMREAFRLSELRLSIQRRILGLSRTRRAAR